MNRKCPGIFVALLAVICVVFGNQEECGESKVAECKEMLLNVLFGDLSEEEICETFGEATKCLRNVVDECLGHERNPGVEKSMKDIEDYLKEECPATPARDGDEVQQCLDENKDYLLECIIDRETGEVTELQGLDLDGTDPDFVQCLLYGRMAHCVVGRSEEKCGVAGGQRAEEMLSKLPTSVQDSCDSQKDSREDSVQEFFSVNLLDQREERDVDYRKKRNV